MNIWFSFFLLTCGISIFLIMKIRIMKRELKSICQILPEVIDTDTNCLITLNTKDKELKRLATTLNENLKKLRKLEIEYRQGNQELKSSITNISHDLRTPLTAIRGYLDLLEDKNLNRKQHKYLKTMDQKVKELIFLSEQLFDFSKGMDTFQSLEKKEVVLNDLLEDVVASFYGLFLKYHITPTIDICKVKVKRFLNEGLVKRVFENIISNGIKYGEDDFRIKLDQEGVIEFSNRTSILDKVSLEKLFDRYYTVENAEKANGIGLSIAKQFVELMNGEIKAVYQDGFFIIRINF